MTSYASARAPLPITSFCRSLDWDKFDRMLREGKVTGIVAYPYRLEPPCGEECYNRACAPCGLDSVGADWRIVGAGVER